jgi:hypothetical protein
MEGTKPDRRRNPFLLGTIGLLLALAGTALTTHLGADSDARRIADRMRQAVPQTGESEQTASVLERTQNYYYWQQLGVWIGQTTFLIGLALSIAAGMIWYRQAQHPEPEPTEPAPEMAEPES